MKRVTAAPFLTHTLALATSVATVTVTNTSAGEFTVGIDMGATEKVETIAAGTSIELARPFFAHRRAVGTTSGCLRTRGSISSAGRQPD